MEKLKCLKCNHSWIPRTDSNPVSCPNCKSRFWDTKKNSKETLKGGDENGFKEKEERSSESTSC